MNDLENLKVMAQRHEDRMFKSNKNTMLWRVGISQVYKMIKQDDFNSATVLLLELMLRFEA